MERPIKFRLYYLIAAGGDGTMSKAVNGIMQVERSKRENLIAGLYLFESTRRLKSVTKNRVQNEL